MGFFSKIFSRKDESADPAKYAASPSGREGSFYQGDVSVTTSVRTSYGRAVPYDPKDMAISSSEDGSFDYRDEPYDPTQYTGSSSPGEDPDIPIPSLNRSIFGINIGEKFRIVGACEDDVSLSDEFLASRRVESTNHFIRPPMESVLGRTFGELQPELTSFYQIIEGPDGFPLIYYENELIGPAKYVTVLLSKRSLPKRLSFKSRNGMSNLLNNKNLSDCCISVPVHFTCRQRGELFNAAIAAHWRPCRLLHNTTAAALAYRFCSTDLLEDGNMFNMAFIDVGYSIMQVSIIKLKRDQLEVLSHTHSKLPLPDESLDMDIDRMDGTRFEKISDHEVREALHKALNEAGLAMEDVYDVEFVGHERRMPQIMNIVAKIFRKQLLRQAMKLEHISLGCFIQCAMICLAPKMPMFQIIDILPYSVEMNAGTENRVVFPKGSHMPSTKNMTFLRSSTFFIDLLCANYPDDSEPGDMISYMIGPFDYFEEREVSIKVQIELHGISCIESATVSLEESYATLFFLRVIFTDPFSFVPVPLVPSFISYKSGYDTIPVVEYSYDPGHYAEQQKLLIDCSKQVSKFLYMQAEKRIEMDKIIADERIQKQKLHESKAALDVELHESKTRHEILEKQHEYQQAAFQYEINKAKKELLDVSEQLKRTEDSLSMEISRRVEVENSLHEARSELQKLQEELLIEREERMNDSKVYADQINVANDLLELTRKQHEELEFALRNDIQKADKELADVSLQYEVILKDEKSEHFKELQTERDNALKEVGELRQMIEWQSGVVNFKIFSLLDLKKATNNFDISLKIGAGGYGSVYKGILQNKQVAVKILNDESLHGETEFNREVEILTQARHPNIIPLLGACREAQALIFEFASNGSLDTFLTNGKASSRNLLWLDRIRIASEICSALIFLHSILPHGIVHGDLKPENILLDSNYVSKLADFGISRKLQKINQRTTLFHLTDNPKFTPAYCDPDFFSSSEVTAQGDIYSYGIIVLQLVTGRDPKRIKDFVEEANETDKWDEVVDISAGEWPIEEAKKLALLGLRCSDPSRRKRPDLAKDVLPLIESMKNFAELTFKKQ